MENSINERIKRVLSEMKISVTAFSKIVGSVQTTINRQLNGETQLSAETVEAFLHFRPEVSAEWLMRGNGEMFLQNADGKTEDLQFLREKIIRLEAENKVLREVAGLRSDEHAKGVSA